MPFVCSRLLVSSCCLMPSSSFLIRAQRQFASLFVVTVSGLSRRVKIFWGYETINWFSGFIRRAGSGLAGLWDHCWGYSRCSERARNRGWILVLKLLLHVARGSRWHFKISQFALPEILVLKCWKYSGLLQSIYWPDLITSCILKYPQNFSRKFQNRISRKVLSTLRYEPLTSFSCPAQPSPHHPNDY